MRDQIVGFSVCDYHQEAQALIRAFKEKGETELASFMAAELRILLGCFIEPFDILVPVPSNRNAKRERGFNPAEVLCRELSKLSPGLSWRNLLSRSRETLDQSKLGKQGRRENQFNSMVTGSSGNRILLVDDVVTTGATLTQAKEVLENSKNIVVGFVTFAETEPNRRNVTTQAPLA